MKRILNTLTIVTTLGLISCSDSSSSGDNNTSESPSSLVGKTLSGKIYVDFGEGDGWEVITNNEDIDYNFISETQVSFTYGMYDQNDKHFDIPVTVPYTYEKTGGNTGHLVIVVQGYHETYDLNLTFSGESVDGKGIFKEGNHPPCNSYSVFRLK